MEVDGGFVVVEKLRRFGDRVVTTVVAQPWLVDGWWRVPSGDWWVGQSMRAMRVGESAVGWTKTRQARGRTSMLS
mgnify:CR=1 FL=1